MFQETPFEQSHNFVYFIKEIFPVKLSTAGRKRRVQESFINYSMFRKFLKPTILKKKPIDSKRNERGLSSNVQTWKNLETPPTLETKRRCTRLLLRSLGRARR